MSTLPPLDPNTKTPEAETPPEPWNCVRVFTCCFSDSIQSQGTEESSQDVCCSCVKQLLRATGQWLDDAWKALKTWGTKLYERFFASKPEKAPESVGNKKIIPDDRKVETPNAS